MEQKFVTDVGEALRGTVAVFLPQRKPLKVRTDIVDRIRKASAPSFDAAADW